MYLEKDEKEVKMNPRKDGLAKIKVIGVGGAGNNSVNRMIEAGIKGGGIDFIAVNTDRQVLEVSKAPKKIQIGEQLTRGLGAGGTPTVGEQAAEESREALEACLDDTDMVFITAGMGGGTGTGAAPVIAEIAKQKNILTFAIVTKPFTFEGKRKAEQAEIGLEKLGKIVDALIVVPNDKLLQVVDRKTSMKDAFLIADDVLRQGVQGVVSILTSTGNINLDFADLHKIVYGKGIAHMGVGRATGENRAEDATKLAMASPLLETTIDGAKTVMYNVAASEAFGIQELATISNLIKDTLDPYAEIISGTIIDETLGDELVVTIIATGFSEKEEDAEEDFLRKPWEMNNKKSDKSDSELEIDIPNWLTMDNDSKYTN